MPVTKSEMLFFAAGAAFGAAAGANYPLSQGEVRADHRCRAGRRQLGRRRFVRRGGQKSCRESRGRPGRHGGDEAYAPPTTEPPKPLRYNPRPLLQPNNHEHPWILLSVFPTSGRIHLESRFLFPSPTIPIAANSSSGLPGAGNHPGHDQERGWDQRDSASGIGFLSADIHAQAGCREGDGIAQPWHGSSERIESTHERQP